MQKGGMDGGCSIQIGVTRRARSPGRTRLCVVGTIRCAFVSLREIQSPSLDDCQTDAARVEVLATGGEGVAKKASLPRLAGASGGELLRLGGEVMGVRH